MYIYIIRTCIANIYLPAVAAAEHCCVRSIKWFVGQLDYSHAGGHFCASN